MTTTNSESEKKAVSVSEKPKESLQFNALDRIYQRFEKVVSSPETTVEIRIQAAEKAIKELQDLITFSAKRTSEKIKNGPDILAGAAARSGGTPDADIADKLKASCSGWLERAQNLEHLAMIELIQLLKEKNSEPKAKVEVVKKNDTKPMLDFLKAFGLPATDYAATAKKTSEQRIIEK